MLPTVLDTGSEIRVETLSQSVARVFLHSSVPCGFSTLCWGCSTWRYANEGKYERDSPGTSAYAQGAIQKPPPQRHPKDVAFTQPGSGAGPWPPVPCLSQAWTGPPRRSFLVSFVVSSTTREAPGVPDTQSTTLGTNLETGNQIKLK